MGIVFIDGFDHYPAAQLNYKWDTLVNSGGLISTTYGRYGSSGIRIGDTQAIRKTIVPTNKVIVGVAFKSVRVMDNTDRIIIAFFLNDTPQCELRLDPSGMLKITRNGTLVSQCTNAPITPGVTYFLEFKTKATTNTSAGDVVVRLSGVPILTSAGGWNVAGTGNTTINQVQLGHGLRGLFNSNYLVDFDDLYVLDGNGTRNNDLIGDQRVELQRINSVGSVTGEFTAVGAADVVAAVNESTADFDTSYITADTPGQTQTFHMNTLTTEPNSVAGLQIVVMSKKDDAGTRVGAGVVKIGGTVYEGPQFGIADAYTISRSMFDTNPATGVPWTPEEVNALEAGIKLVQ